MKVSRIRKDHVRAWEIHFENGSKTRVFSRDPQYKLIERRVMSAAKALQVDRAEIEYACQNSPKRGKIANWLLQPLQGEQVVVSAKEVYAEDGIVVGWGGEKYSEPMTAKSTWEKREIEVKMGDSTHHFPALKKVESSPATEMIILLEEIEVEKVGLYEISNL